MVNFMLTLDDMTYVASTLINTLEQEPIAPPPLPPPSSPPEACILISVKLVLVHFLHFYKLLVVVLKICIAKHDEKLLSEKMQKD